MNFDIERLDNVKINVKKKKLFNITTFGCQMNEEDSEKLSGMLKRMGYESTENKENASIIIFNTCCVRENAENKVFGNLGRLKKQKEKNPDLIIGICGCMMQQKGMADDILKRFPYVDIIFGTHNSYKFPEYLNKVKTESVQIKEIMDKETEIVEGIPIDRKSDAKAFVTIMYGCNNFCTYCIVPYVRGRERSRKPEDIENEIRELVANGYKEVTLLGQNVNSYGKELAEGLTFAELLSKINEIEGLERIRFMTSHPKDLTLDVVYAIRDCAKICEQIHLPVQSGSDRILKEMNRHYTKKQYLELAKEIRKEIPDVTFSTDIIVGFPGETDEDFNETLELIKEVKFDAAFTYLYSRRNHTPADRMENQISDEVKHERFNRLVETANAVIAKGNKDAEGRIYEVLVEGHSKNNHSKLTGRTRNARLVNFEGGEELIGTLVNVKIVKANSFSLIGEVIK